MSIHIGGLSSGTDYQSLVDQLMAARQIPIESKQTEMEELDYDMGAWTQLRTLGQELSTSLDTLRGYDLWRDMSVNSTDETTVTATATTSATEQAYSLTVSNLAVAQSISSDQVSTPDDLLAVDGVNEGDQIEIEGQTITLDADETLSSLRVKINDAAVEMSDETRVMASIIDNRLVLTREMTGAASITLSNVTGTPLRGLGIFDESDALKNENVEGADAHFTVNGLSVTRSDNTELTDVIEGVTLTLRDSGTTNLNVQPDRDSAKAAILDFVEKYNTFADQADSYSSIAMGSSSDLVQKGELYGDSLMTTIETNIRRYATSVKSPALNETNAGYTSDGKAAVMDSLSDVGIWTTGEANELELVDEDKLDEVLEYNFDLVAQLFRGTYDSTEIAYTNGVAADFYQYMTRISETLTGDIDERIDALTEKYDDLSDEVDELEDALDDYEQDQWDTFTQMEDATAEMNSQLAYISSMFGDSS